MLVHFWLPRLTFVQFPFPFYSIFFYWCSWQVDKIGRCFLFCFMILIFTWNLLCVVKHSLEFRKNYSFFMLRFEIYFSSLTSIALFTISWTKSDIKELTIYLNLDAWHLIKFYHKFSIWKLVSAKLWHVLIYFKLFTGFCKDLMYSQSIDLWCKCQAYFILH